MKTIIFAALLALAPMVHADEPTPTEPFGVRCEGEVGVTEDYLVSTCAASVRKLCNSNFAVLKDPPVVVSDVGIEPKWIMFTATCVPFLKGSI